PRHSPEAPAEAPAFYQCAERGKPHLLVDVSEGGVFDGARATRDLERIVTADEALWGTLHYEKYVFFTLLTGTSGGLEHRNSVMMMATRWSQGTRAGYLDWLSLA